MSFTDFTDSLPAAFDQGAIERAVQFLNDHETDSEASSTGLALHGFADALNKLVGNLAESNDLERDQLLFLDSLVCQLWLGDPATVGRWSNLALVPYMEWRDQGAYPPPVPAHPASILPYLRRRADTTTRADLRARYHDFLLLHPSTPRHDRRFQAQAAHTAYAEAGAAFDVSELTQTAIAFEYLGRALDLSAAYNFGRSVTAVIALARMRTAVEGGAFGFACQVASRQARLLTAAPAEATEFVEFAIGAASQSADHQARRALWEMVENISAKLRDFDTVGRARLAVAVSWETEADEHMGAEGALARVVRLHEALGAYRRVGGATESTAIERLKAPYAEASQLAAKQMTLVQTTKLTVIERDEMKALMAAEAKWIGETPHAWLALALHWGVWPDWDDVRARFDEMRSLHPIEWLMSRIKVTSDGRVIFPPEDEAKREATYLLDYFVRERLITAAYFRIALDTLHQEGAWTAETLAAAVGAADEVLAAACSSGFRAYEAGDCWTATHVLIPQLERVLRDIALRSSASVLRLVTNQSLEVATLGPILSDQRVVQVLTPTVVRSLTALFTDSEGLNIRNEIAHGLVSPHEDMGNAAFLTVMAVLTAAYFLGFVKQEARKHSED